MRTSYLFRLTGFVYIIIVTFALVYGLNHEWYTKSYYDAYVVSETQDEVVIKYDNGTRIAKLNLQCDCASNIKNVEYVKNNHLYKDSNNWAIVLTVFSYIFAFMMSVASLSVIIGGTDCLDETYDKADLAYKTLRFLGYDPVEPDQRIVNMAFDHDLSVLKIMKLLLDKK